MPPVIREQQWNTLDGMIAVETEREALALVRALPRHGSTERRVYLRGLLERAKAGNLDSDVLRRFIQLTATEGELEQIWPRVQGL